MVAASVILSSRNGARVLPTSLEAFARLEPPPGGWEMIAVDNASSDATGEILRGFAHRLPLTVLEEPRPGKNKALNAALARAKGELVVFTDDDVVPEPDWLVRLLVGAAANPDFHLFGGGIRPLWPRDPPGWLISADMPLDMLYAINERPHGPVPAGCIWGPNMAVRASVFREGWRFDETIGPSNSAQYAMGSEVEFNNRLEKAGFRGYFLADAVVGHVIRPEQLERPWVVARAYRHGRGYCRYSPLPATLAGPVFGGLPVQLILRLSLNAPLASLARLLPGSALLLKREFNYNWLRGVADDLREKGMPS